MSTSHWWSSDEGAVHPGDDVPLPASTDVAVVGAGIAGLAVATELVRRGRRVAVIDMARPGSGTTGSSTAKVTALHGASLSKVRDHHGTDGARAYATANQLGVAQLRSMVEDLDENVGWVSDVSTTYTTDPGRIAELDREHDAAGDAGLLLQRRDELDLPVGAVAALILGDQARVDPVRLTGALANALRSAGHPVVLGCRVVGVERGARPVVHTDRGVLRADHVVMTALTPAVDPLGLFARMAPTTSYLLAARLRAPAPAGMHLSIDDPSRSVRPAGPSESRVALIGGGSHRVGEGGDTTVYARRLNDWATGCFGQVDVLAQWSAHDMVPTDSVPFIGRCGDDDDLLVATGFRKWGFSHSGAASLLLAGILEGEEPEWGAVFDPRRPVTTSLRSACDALKGNLDVARHFVGDRLGTLSPSPIDRLAPGSGGIVDLDGTKVAAYRSEDGRTTVRSARCPHLGCQVVWNAFATTWDCPCHGSRFDTDGQPIAGPTTRPLATVERGDGAERQTRGT